MNFFLLQDPLDAIERAQRASSWVEHVGVASICFFMLMAVCWYFVKREKAVEQAHEAEKSQIRADFQAVIDQKNTVLEQLSTQIDHVTAQANTRLDRMVQMIADGGVATQGVLADNAAAMATNQQALQAVKNELQQLRNTVDRIRGGGA
jgi:hypothetical protein